MNNSNAVTLCENAGTGNQPDVQVNCGGKYSFVAEATFGGGSVKLQMRLPRGTYFDIPSTSFTVAGMFVFDLPSGSYRVVNTTATAVYAYLVGISG